MQDSAAQRFGDYIAGENLATLPADVVAKARLCVQDAVGCLLGASGTPVAQTMAGFAADLPGHDAFVHATLINALDYDDIYKKGHLGATVVAAALSLARRPGLSGTDLIEAVIAGYEVSGRVGISLVQSAPRKTLHGHGTWQTMGAAATAAKLLKLDARRAAHAVAIAAANAPVASVMKTVYGAAPGMAKNNFGAAAQLGVDAAFLAHRGFEGPLDIFEGETGFWRMFGADGCDHGVLTRSLGETYEIREVGFKPYSCCRILQSSIEAAVTLFRQARIDPRGPRYRSILMSTPAIVCAAPFNDARPRDMWAAQFSAPYTIALALLGVEPGPDWFAPERFADPEVAALAHRVRLQPYVAGGKSSHHAAAAAIELDDGSVLNAEVGVAKGEAANPLSEEALDRKFLRLAATLPDAGMPDRALDAVKKMESAALSGLLYGLGGT